jgi:hypothetical protein
MALTDIVFEQANTFEALRGNVGTVQDILNETAVTALIQSGVLQSWNSALAVWEVFPLRYRTSDGWV